jgi:hypothetical protein
LTAAPALVGGRRVRFIPSGAPVHPGEIWSTDGCRYGT